jgi:lysine 2-monooxygenase
MKALSKKSNLNCDVLIAGAGMAGLFAAWRLLNDPKTKNLNIIIVDKLNRTGGRLQTTTVAIKGTDGNNYNVKDEEGGMRFVPQGTGMENLWTLMVKLNLKTTTVPFVMGDNNNKYNFRGKSFTFGEAEANNNAIWGTLFNLAPYEKNLSPVGMLLNIMQDILNQNPGGYKAGQWPNSPETWIQFRNTFTFKDSTGKPIVINNWGFWSLLRTYGATEESIVLMSQAIGFMGPFEAFINAGESLQIIFDFPAAANFFTLRDGYEALPSALEKAIRSNKNARFVFGEEILNVAPPVGNITTVSGKLNNYTVGKINIEGKVILAVPKNALKHITQASPLLSANKKFVTAISSVQNMQLSKVGLYFKERWWHQNPKINLTNGPNFTDLPVGSIYTFSQFPTDAAKDAAYNGPAALTLYTDFIRGNFWEEMQNIGPKYKPLDNLLQPANTYPASVNLVNELMKQIKMLFGLSAGDTTVPKPLLTTYRVWGESEFGYGYHQYKLNVNDIEDVYFNIWNPAKNVFVCNEAWSPEQGWVEGSLIMSDFVMVLGFKMLPFDYNPKTNSFITNAKKKIDAKKK